MSFVANSHADAKGSRPRDNTPAIPWFLMERVEGRVVVPTMHMSGNNRIFTRICASLVLIMVSGTMAHASDGRHRSHPSSGGYQGTSQEQTACSPDAKRFCKDAFPDTFQVLQCLQEHHKRLRRACRNVLKSHGVLNPQ
jgi:hypothetical protein